MPEKNGNNKNLILLAKYGGVAVGIIAAFLYVKFQSQANANMLEKLDPQVRKHETSIAVIQSELGNISRHQEDQTDILRAILKK